ncbi:MAG: NAD-dependent epimerase/dehydratase family protein [Acidimicrobiia bacterium]|nr:NAD-dependent epimerase/dehydratase family protein [Acidimicrobiia bacterium]
MRVLVTGGTGFIGSWATLAFLDAGHDVRLLVRDPAKATRVFAAHGRDVPDTVVGDMADAAAVGAALDGCDAVLHAAAQVGVADGNTAGIAANVAGVRTVIGAALDAGLDPILYTSSVIALYPPRTPVLDVDAPLADPAGPYGRSKVAAETWVRARQAEGAPITSVLLGGVVGPRQPVIDSATTGIIAAARQVMVVPPGGVGVLDVRDAAALLVAALEPGRGPRRYLAGGPFLAWPEWTDTLSAVLGRRARRMRTPTWSLTGLGRTLDALKRFRSFDYPMTYEAALAMTCAVPTDDSATLADLGLAWRAPADTFRDAVAWLLAEGHLRPKDAPAVAPMATAGDLGSDQR